MTRHLTQEQLLRHLDGEMSKPAMRRAAKHLQACWSCQVEYRRLQDDIAAILDAQTNVFGPSLPPPPNPWPRLEPRLNRTTRYQAAPFWTKLSVFSRVPVRMQFVYGCAALAALIAGFLLFVPVSRVSAQEVLARVKAADAGRFAITENQVVRQRVRIKKTARAAPSTQTARLESWKSPKSTYWNSAGDAVNSDLLRRYQANGLSSALPLSPPALEEWVKLAGSALSASQEGEYVEVRVSSSGSERSGGLEGVSAQVRKVDWHLAGMTLVFAAATFQITEEDSAIVARSEVPSDVLARLEPEEPETPRTASRPTPVPPSSTSVNLDDVEMAVRYELHSIGADLGENIEVTPLSPDRILVKAWGVSPQRREELASRLANTPDVLLQLERPESDKLAGKAVTLPQTGSSPPPSDPRLAQFFGGPETQENYTRSVLQAGSSVLAHLYALRDLGARWPPEKEESLSPDAKTQLSTMVRDHAREIRAGAFVWEAQADLLLKGSGNRATGGIARSASDWQAASTSGLDAARRVDQVLRSLLTTSDTPLTLDDALPRLQQSLRDLDWAIQDLPASAP